MKITIAKDAILLSEKAEAMEMAKSEAEWIDADVLKYCAREILENHYDKTVYISDILKLPRLKICKNHYKMTVYAEDMIVMDHISGEGDFVHNIGFDVIATYNEGERSAFLQTYKSTGHGVI